MRGRSTSWRAMLRSAPRPVGRRIAMNRTGEVRSLLFNTNVWLDFYYGDKPDTAATHRLFILAAEKDVNLLFALTTKDVYSAHFKALSRAENGGSLFKRRLINLILPIFGQRPTRRSRYKCTCAPRCHRLSLCAHQSGSRGRGRPRSPRLRPATRGARCTSRGSR